MLKNNSWHTSEGCNFWALTGQFTAGGTSNTGKGLWSYMFFAGTKWLQDEPLPWAASAFVRFETFGKQKTTGIQPGDVMTLEFAAGKEVLPGFDLGINAYANFQRSTEKGSAAGTDITKYRFYGIGPEINWRPEALPVFQAAVRVTWETRAPRKCPGWLSGCWPDYLQVSCIPLLQRHHPDAEFGIVHSIESISPDSERLRMCCFEVLRHYTNPGCYRVGFVFPRIEFQSVFGGSNGENV